MLGCLALAVLWSGGCYSTKIIAPSFMIVREFLKIYTYLKLLKKWIDVFQAFWIVLKFVKNGAKFYFFDEKKHILYVTQKGLKTAGETKMLQLISYSAAGTVRFVFNPSKIENWDLRWMGDFLTSHKIWARPLPDNLKNLARLAP